MAWWAGPGCFCFPGFGRPQGAFTLSVKDAVHLRQCPPGCCVPGRRYHLPRLIVVVPGQAQVGDFESPDPGEARVFADISLGDILKRGYFSGGWVIQELVLSREVLIPIRDVEFLVNSLTWRHLFGPRPGWLGMGQLSSRLDVSRISRHDY